MDEGFRFWHLQFGRRAEFERRHAVQREWAGPALRRGEVVGKVTLTQISIGFQVGGQKFIEAIFFDDAAAFERFVGSNYEFNAQVSAVALTDGESADAAYAQGVAVFTVALGGLMYEAAVGGQKFSYEPN